MFECCENAIFVFLLWLYSESGSDVVEDHRMIVFIHRNAFRSSLARDQYFLKIQ